MITYELLKGKDNLPKITIDEDSKEDFKKMMKWTEKDWKQNIRKIRKEK